MTFVGDMWPNKDGEEPEWVKSEREQFNTYRDKNSDGKMDHEEVKDWIIPPDYDHTDAESKHLIYESDTNKVCNHKSYWLKCVTWFGNYCKQTRLNYFMLLIPFCFCKAKYISQHTELKNWQNVLFYRNFYKKRCV